MKTDRLGTFGAADAKSRAQEKRRQEREVKAADRHKCAVEEKQKITVTPFQTTLGSS